MPINLDFGFVVFLCLLTVGAIVIGVFLGKRFTKTAEPTKTVLETVQEFPAANIQPPVAPSPPPPPKPAESLADKSKRVVDNQKKMVQKDFEDSFMHYISRGSYSFTSVCKSFNTLPKEITVKILRKVIDEFEKANPTLKVEANFKYSSGYSSNIVVVTIIAKG